MTVRTLRHLAFAPTALAAAAVTLATSSLAAGALPLTRAGAAQATESTYIVVLEATVVSPVVVARQHSRDYGVEVGGIYVNALKGYVADMTAQEAAQVSADPSTLFVELDQQLQISQTTQAQSVPTGVRRIFADDNTRLDIDGNDDARIDVDVAVIDTGVLAHSDLNVLTRYDCTTGICRAGTGNDDNGHGTHVAGTIGAIDNASGVVGVAPGARIHSLKVCTASGSCPNSAIVAAVDNVTGRATIVEVVNMSLGGAGTSAALQTAINRSIVSGIVYAVAAGNNGANASGYFPASFPDVITVSAVADSDGNPGGTGGAPPCRPSARDDVRADFSNYGTVVDIAAPGVCILSTYNNGGTATMSGTSMASPHVAGAAALLASGSHDPVSRAQVIAIRDQLVAAGNLGWTDNSGDGVKERLLDVHDSTRFPPTGGVTPPPATNTIYSDTFEAAAGWTVNPSGNDTATGGRWERGDPAATSYSGTTLQLGTTTSGVSDLSTGRLAGTSAGANDLDGGSTTIRSPAITLPANGALSLSVRWYLGHLSNATTADFFRIRLVTGSTSTIIFQQVGTGANRNATWGTATSNLTQYAGQTIRLQFEAADYSTPSLLEVGVDDVRIIQQT